MEEGSMSRKESQLVITLSERAASLKWKDVPGAGFITQIGGHYVCVSEKRNVVMILDIQGSGPYRLIREIPHDSTSLMHTARRIARDTDAAIDAIVNELRAR